MSDFEAPSFSLGLEFDLDSPKASLKEEEEEEDDIDDDSQQETTKDASGNKCHSLATCSKLPLPLFRKTGYALTSHHIHSNPSKVLPTQKSISPVRRFQLIDSDSDDSFLDDMVTSKDNNFVLNAKDRDFDLHTNENFPNKVVEQDLWRGFFPEKGVHIPTPAFDQVCEEFFSSANEKKPIENKTGGCSQTCNFRNKRVQQFNQTSQSPAHTYFFHDDPEIQKLIRHRLPNFSPLGAATSQGCQNQDVSAFDYISQFGHGNSSSVPTRYPGELNSTKGRKNKRNAKGVVTPELENCFNPKRSSGGQRRIQDGEKSAGHWFTNAEGRKVYITKTGQEMTGQQAYRNFRKESGSGYRKSQKKSTNKKKAAAKKK